MNFAKNMKDTGINTLSKMQTPPTLMWEHSHTNMECPSPCRFKLLPDPLSITVKTQTFLTYRKFPRQRLSATFHRRKTLCVELQGVGLLLFSSPSSYLYKVIKILIRGGFYRPVKRCANTGSI